MDPYGEGDEWNAPGGPPFECSEADIDESAGQAELCTICGKRIEPAARYFTSAGLPRHMLCERRGAIDESAGQAELDWRYEVSNGDTKLGLAEWIEHRREAGMVDAAAFYAGKKFDRETI